MKKEQILNGMSEKEFYKLYPTKESYIKANGGSIEAFPTQPDAERFFSYGVVPNSPVGFYQMGGPNQDPNQQVPGNPLQQPQDPNGQDQSGQMQQIIQVIAQALQKGAKPEEIISQLSQKMDHNQAVKLVQQTLDSLHQAQTSGVGNEQPQLQVGGVSSTDSLRHQASKTMDYEFNKGSAQGTRLSNYGNPALGNNPTKDQAVDWYMQNIAPQLGNYKTAMEKGEAGDFLYNTGKDARVYAYQHYLTQTDPNNTTGWKDKDGNWKDRKNIPENFDELYNNSIGKLSENDRRIHINRGRDWYYQHINQVNGQPNPAYENTWKPRINEAVNTYLLGGENPFPGAPTMDQFFSYGVVPNSPVAFYQEGGRMQEKLDKRKELNHDIYNNNHNLDSLHNLMFQSNKTQLLEKLYDIGNKGDSLGLDNINRYFYINNKIKNDSLGYPEFNPTTEYNPQFLNFGGEPCIECGDMPQAKDGHWIQKATKNMRTDHPCTGAKFGSSSCPPGSRRYNLAKTFRHMAKKALGGESDKSTSPDADDMFLENYTGNFMNNIKKNTMMALADEAAEHVHGMFNDVDHDNEVGEYPQAKFGLNLSRFQDAGQFNQPTPCSDRDKMNPGSPCYQSGFNIGQLKPQDNSATSADIDRMYNQSGNNPNPQTNAPYGDQNINFMDEVNKNNYTPQASNPTGPWANPPSPYTKQNEFGQSLENTGNNPLGFGDQSKSQEEAYKNTPHKGYNWQQWIPSGPQAAEATLAGINLATNIFSQKDNADARRRQKNMTLADNTFMTTPGGNRGDYNWTGQSNGDLRLNQKVPVQYYNQDGGAAQYNEGDEVDMSPEEIVAYLAQGGQIEFV